MNCPEGAREATLGCAALRLAMTAVDDDCSLYFGERIRIEEEMLEKLGFVADYEGRSVNSHILVLVRENIRAFEEQHGPIEGSIRPDVNVKPTRK